MVFSSGVDSRPPRYTKHRPTRVPFLVPFHIALNFFYSWHTRSSFPILKVPFLFPLLLLGSPPSFLPPPLLCHRWLCLSALFFSRHSLLRPLQRTPIGPSTPHVPFPPDSRMVPNACAASTSGVGSSSRSVITRPRLSGRVFLLLSPPSCSHG